MRKQSVATQLRHAKRDINELIKEKIALDQRNRLLKSTGSIMSNILYNLKQSDRFSQEEKALFAKYQTEWDKL